jgi:hypothetical protein
MQMLETSLGTYPVVGTFKQCVRTKKGWRGIDDATGTVYNFIRRDGRKAEAPEDHVLQMVDNKIAGVMLVKWKRHAASHR